MVIKPRHALFSWKGWRGLCFCVLPPAQNVFPSSRRGGACPSRHSVAGGPSFHTVGVGHWPARFLFSGQFRSTHPRPCTLCHGWSEPGAAVKWHRPKFCTAPGPSGPGEIIPGTIFCAPEILRKGIGVSPVNGGLGENELEPEGTCFRRRCESPPAILWFLSHRWERNSPKGRNPPRGMKPVPKPAGGSGDPPLRGFRRITAKTDNGRTLCAPTADMDRTHHQGFFAHPPLHQKTRPRETLLPGAPYCAYR